MKQKVQIDVLDVSLFERANDLDSSGESPSGDPPEGSPGGKWPTSKKILIGLCLILVSASLTAALFIFAWPTKKPDGHAIGRQALSTQQDRERSAALQDMIISFKDHSGKDRLLVCSLVLDAGSDDRFLSRQQVVDLRKFVYKIVLEKQTKDPAAMRDKNRLKDHIVQEMNQRFGNRFLSGIYFTKFVIL